nr:uncharacterized protein CFP56_32222 [Quercus suber]
MPFRPPHSLLRVEVPALTDIDTSSVESLFGMWSLFSKTSHAMEDGKRLENLSWRLWNRETFCCDPRQQARSTLAPRYTFTQSQTATDIPMPALSSSLHSASSHSGDEDFDPAARSSLRRSDSTTSTSRGREKHITPVDLQNIVISIKETSMLEPNELALPDVSPVVQAADASSTAASQRITPQTTKTSTGPQPDRDADRTPHQPSTHATLLESSSSTVATTEHTSPTQSFGSSDTSATEMSTHSIIRGFRPGGAPSSYRSQTNLAAQPTPILKSSSQYMLAQPKKKAPMFTIGTSSGEEESSLESHMYKSSLSESLRRSQAPVHSNMSKKQTSFKEEIAIGRAAEHSPVFESDDEDEEVSESAIEDDDDSSDWEDSDDQSGPSSMTERDLFQRVDSRPNLTSRRSLLTTLMHEPDRARALANAASRSTPAIRRSRACSPSGPSLATSPDPVMAVPSQAHPRGKPIIMTTSNTHPTQLALSPRTTRRNMLSDELTESLRKHLLWERQHRSIGNFTAIKRRHTSHDVKNLKQHPEPAPVISQKNGKTFTNEYFHAGLQEYHAKGCIGESHSYTTFPHGTIDPYVAARRGFSRRTRSSIYGQSCDLGCGYCMRTLTSECGSRPMMCLPRAVCAVIATQAPALARETAGSSTVCMERHGGDTNRLIAAALTFTTTTTDPHHPAALAFRRAAHAL